MSTEEQAAGLSLDAQLDEITRYAKSRNAVIVQNFKETASGADKTRPVLNQALQALTVADGLIVWKLDRLTRSLPHLLTILEKLQEAGKSLWIAADGLEFNFSEGSGIANLSARLLLTVLGIVAETERELIRERSIFGKVALLKQGVWMGGNKPPFGYTLTEDRRLAINPEEADIVARIYHLYTTTDISVYKLARIFKLTMDMVHRVLSNPVYKGEYRFHVGAKKRYRSHHNRKYFSDTENVIVVPAPPIVSEEIWEKAQQKLRARGGFRYPSCTYGWWTGLVKCGVCGKSFVRFAPYYWTKDFTKRRMHYLRCSNLLCENFTYYIRLDLLEDFIVSLLPQTLEAVYANLKREIEESRVQLDPEALRVKREQYLELFRAGLISYDELVRELQTIQSLMRSAQNRLASHTMLEVLEKLRRAKNLKRTWDSLTMDLKTALVRAAFHRITVSYYTIQNIASPIPLRYERVMLITRAKKRYEDVEPVIREIWEQKGEVRFKEFMGKTGIKSPTYARKFLIEFCARNGVHPLDLNTQLQLTDEELEQHPEWLEPPQWLKRIIEMHQQGYGYRKIARALGRFSQDTVHHWLVKLGLAGSRREPRDVKEIIRAHRRKTPDGRRKRGKP